MGFVFHYISDATEPSHFTQPARALKFYNFVCSIERNAKAKKRPLNDIEADREIISFYVHYHYLLSQNNTTGSNALIGTWQKKLGHQKLWEDFNLEYESGPPPMNGNECTLSRPTRAPARKSTGGIPASKRIKKYDPLPRRRSFDCFSDSSLTPLPSSDDEDDTALRITTIARDSNDLPVGSADQGVSQDRTPQDVIMDSADEPPPTPPQTISSLIASPHYESANSTAAFTQVVSESILMNGTFVFATRLRSGRELPRSVTGFNNGKSLSNHVLRSSKVPYQNKGRRTSRYLGEPSKKKNHVEEPPEQPMVVDTPSATDLEPEQEPLSTGIHQDATLSEPFIPGLSGSPPLKISIRPPVSIPPIVPEIRVPLSISCINTPLPRPAPVQNPDPSPGGLKGPSVTPAVVAPRISRPTLPSNPPIWAQVRMLL